MRVNFTDGIEIVIDDEKLIGWQQSSDKNFILLTMQENNGFVNYEIDIKDKEIHNGSK